MPGGCESDSEVSSDFLEKRRCKPGLFTTAYHALNSTSPLLDETEITEYTANNPVAKFRYTMPDIIDRQAEQEQPRILHLQAIIIDRDTDRCSALGVIGMNDRVDDSLPDGSKRIRPSLRPLDSIDDKLSGYGSLDEYHRLFHSNRGIAGDVNRIEDPAAVSSVEATGLYPGIGEISVSVFTEENHTTNGWDQTSLLAGHYTQ